MLAEDLVISETLNLRGELQRQQVPVQEVVVNPSSERFLFPGRRGAAASGSSRKLLTTAPSGGYAWWGVPLPKEMRGSLLETFWDGATPVDPARPVLPGAPLNCRPGWRPRPLPVSRDHLFDLRRQGGRGQDYPGLRHRSAPGPGVLRQRDLSSPPIRPLPGRCLKRTLAPPARLAPGLTAMEIDAPGEFAASRSSTGASWRIS